MLFLELLSMNLECFNGAFLIIWSTGSILEIPEIIEKLLLLFFYFRVGWEEGGYANSIPTGLSLSNTSHILKLRLVCGSVVSMELSAVQILCICNSAVEVFFLWCLFFSLSCSHTDFISCVIRKIKTNTHIALTDYFYKELGTVSL